MEWKRIKSWMGIEQKPGPKDSDNTTAPGNPAPQDSQAPHQGSVPPTPAKSGGAAAPKPIHIPSIKASENPWGVPLIDVRPMTLGTLSTSKDPQCAANAVSFQQEDGTAFITQEPKVSRSITGSLTFAIDRMLADGVLFVPRQMEHKWALFHHQRRILCVRSWLRQVVAVADLEVQADHVKVTRIRGVLGNENESPAFTERVLDFLIRSHVLGEVYPAPLPPGMEQQPQTAASWCFAMFGNRVAYATAHEFPRQAPKTPLRTHSLLHIAVARADVASVKTSLASGIPIDLLAADGLAPLHWALASSNPSILQLLLEQGSPVDVRSAEGATPLMNAVQGRAMENTSFLLDKGADPNARDLRGFTALHRAAEMGLVDIARMLLERGASPRCEAEGHTPRSLAEKRNHADMLTLLNTFGG